MQLAACAASMPTKRSTLCGPASMEAAVRCAFDRRKKMDWGAFDAPPRPFFLQDSDLGLMAWKRGWRTRINLRAGSGAPTAWHDPRANSTFPTSTTSSARTRSSMTGRTRTPHRARLPRGAGCSRAAVTGVSPGRHSSARACAPSSGVPPIGEALRARWHARTLAVVEKNHAFRRSRPIYYHDHIPCLQWNPAARGFCLSLMRYGC